MNLISNRMHTSLYFTAILGMALIVFVLFSNVTESASKEGLPEAEDDTELLNLQLLTITDFHGYLNDTSQINTPEGPKTVGGAAYIAAHLDRLEKSDSPTIRLSAGDDFSGWPFEVASFRDEPTIEFLNAIDLDLSVAGNHEFDISKDFLKKHMMDGKCFGVIGMDSCFEDSTGQQFQGADYEYLSANIRDAQSGKLVLKPYIIKEIPDGQGGTVPVGFIGLTTTTTILGTTSFQEGDLTADELLESGNRYAKELQDLGVETIIAVVHEGGADNGDNEKCLNTGPVIDFAKEASPAIDAIVTGHWHATFNCSIDDPDGNPRPIIEGANHGKYVSEVNLWIDPASQDVVREKTTSANHPVTRDIEPDPEIAKLASYWKTRGEQRWAEPVAKLTGDLTRARNANGESTLANFVADSHYATGQTGRKKPADFALTAASSLKGDLLYKKGTNAADKDGQILFGEQWAAHGYDNPIVNVTLTGAQIEQILEEQWRQSPNGVVTFHPLATSYNVRYSYDDSKTVGDRVDPENVYIDNKRLNPKRSYRVAALAYLIRGNDGYPTFLEYENPVRIENDHWAFYAYLKQQKTIAPPELNRVTKLN